MPGEEMNQTVQNGMEHWKHTGQTDGNGTMARRGTAKRTMVKMMGAREGDGTAKRIILRE